MSQTLRAPGAFTMGARCQAQAGRQPCLAARLSLLSRLARPGFLPSAFTPVLPSQSSIGVGVSTICSAKNGDKESAPANTEGNGSSGGIVGSVGLFLLWGALAGYAFLLAPNQTPLRDQYFLEKFLNLTSDGVALNAVFTQLFYIMGVWPLVYTALLVPAAKSRNGVPAWPFFTLSYAVGAFGLLPFMALWQPPESPPVLPPSEEDLQGPGNLLARGMESPVLAWLLLGGAVLCLGQAATAGAAAWEEYSNLLQESRFVHVTTVDFLTLTTLAPFWMDNDATLRKWEGKDKLLPILSLIPVLGPCIYLVLRPKAGGK